MALTTIGAVTLTGLVVGSSGVAQAAVPTFPDNIVVFPDRDFVSAEGFAEHEGQTALIEVTRPGVGVVGSSTAVVELGDHAFEVNHPGGSCWGAGTGLNVTPDIQGGDVVSVKFGGVSAGETTVAGSHVSDIDQSGTRIVVNGVLDGSDTDQIEQRIINPDLKDTEIARRDVRALPGPLVTSDKGGYQSGLDVSGNTFTATYEFETQAAADLAAVGGARIMSWQEEDVDANRQGLTISEFGEVGGPGMGGCPNGPLQAGPPAPTGVTATKIAGGYRLNWTPAVAVPGTPAITGYQVSAVDKTVAGTDALPERSVIGKHLGSRTARTTTLTGLASEAGYDIEIVSVSANGLTFPPVNVHPVEDTTPPVITANPPAGAYNDTRSVTLTSNEANTDIYYTLDGTDPFVGDTLAEAAIPYAGSIAITQTTTLKYVAFDVVSNTSSGILDYTITQDPPPPAPESVTATPAAESVALDWPDVASAIDYSVQILRDGQPDDDAVTVTASQATITGLQAGVTYTATVRARSTGGFGEPVTTEAFTIPVVVKADAGADIAARRGTTVTLDGSGSAPNGNGTTYLWQQVDGVAANAVTLTGATTRTPSFAFPLYRWTAARPMTNAPLRFRLTVTDDGISRTDEVVVSPVNDRLTGTSRWRTGDLRVSGTATTIGSTVDIYRLNANGTRGAVVGSFAVTAAAAPATGGEYTARIRNAAANPNPGRLLVESRMGGSLTITVVAG